MFCVTYVTGKTISQVTRPTCRGEKRSSADLYPPPQKWYQLKNMIQTPLRGKFDGEGGGFIFAGRFGRGGVGRPKSAVTPVRILRPTTLNSKISSISTTSRPLQSYGYTLWKVVYRNIRYMCINLVANITWGPGHAIRSSFPLDFSSPPYLPTCLHSFLRYRNVT